MNYAGVTSSKPDQPFTIRRMSRNEIDLAIDWAAAEGWNPGLADADAFYAADPNGFLMGFLGTEPVECISAVAYGASYGFIGFYIVRPPYRHQGYGLQLWNAAQNHLTGRTVGLDGVIDQQENYKKSGFKIAYRNIRFQGTATLNQTADSSPEPLSNIDFKTLLAYDSLFSPEPRPVFLQHWIHQPNAIALGSLDQKEITGYGMIRPCRTGFKIGPLFANSEAIAESLFANLTANVPAGFPIFLDVPEINSQAVRLAERHQMTRVFETARMYNADPPQLPIHRLFGVTTFELG